MKIDESTASEIGVALNEASLLGAEYNPDTNAVGLTLSVLTLPDDSSPEPEDPRRQIILTEIGRLAGVLTARQADPSSAAVEPFSVSDLLSVVESFGGQAVYGWDFINGDDHGFAKWRRNLSVDHRPREGSLENRIFLFQEGATDDRVLDLWIWFSDLIVRDAVGSTIPLDRFVADGKRWWDALYAHDPRTRGHGIVPGSAS
jgi:hypothetical protein